MKQLENEENGDCNDNNMAVYPGAEEICNGIDDNCDTVIDEGVEILYYADTDTDGFGDANSTIDSCDQPLGYVDNMDDCDDTDATSTTVATDADCDTVLTADACDDTDADSTTIATDADCDTVLTAEDCDDTDITNYSSEQCAHKSCWHLLQKHSDAPLTQCPQCNQDSFQKIVSAPSFQLKGTGWYVTDFRDKGKNTKAEKTSTDNTTSKTETKESKPTQTTTVSKDSSSD